MALNFVIIEYYHMGTGGSYPRDKAARVWSWPLTSN